MANIIAQSVPANGTSYTVDELHALFSQNADASTVPPSLNANLLPFSFLSYDVTTDTIGGDIDSFIDGELASYNFGIHEGGSFPDRTREVFPGCPETKDGFLYANEAPGLGIDLDEKLAAKYPHPEEPTFEHSWGTTRRRDGTVIRP